MKKQTIWVLTTLMFIFFAFSAQAGTRDDCVTKCKEAVQYYQKWGKDATIKEIGNKDGKFVWNDGVSYVFMMDMHAMMMAHPHKPQLTKIKDLIDRPDADGKLFRRDFIKAAEKGKGWTKYVYEVPGMNEIKPKHTFVCRIPDTDYFVASGFYVIKAGVYR